MHEFARMTTQDRSAYYQDWYEKNRNGIRDARRKRYANDPEYAEACRARSRAYRNAQRGTGEERRTGWYVEIRGKEREAFTVGKLGEDTDREIQTISYWHRHKMLPETPLRTSGGVRLYTKGMIKVVADALEKRGTLARNDLRFGSEVRRGWKSLGAYEGSVLAG